MVLLQAAKLMDKKVSFEGDNHSMSSILRASIVQQRKHILPILNFLHTLELFTQADMLTFALPTTLFAVFGAAAGTTLSTNVSAPGLLTILSRVPSILLVVWCNLLVFTIANQRLPDAILEDKLNNPVRPLPSGRISPAQARRVLLVALPVVLALSFCLGPWQETLLLFLLTWMYNDLKGCDEDFVIRNLIIAVGHGLYNSAALRVACGVDSSVTTFGLYWIVLESCVILTTGHIGDIKDQVGDKTRGRRSLPIVLGDGVARYTVAVPVVAWSFACPFFFGLGYWGYVIPVTVGCIIALRILLLRSTHDDIVTWKIWALWTVVLFTLPLAKEHTILKANLGFMIDRLHVESDYSGSFNLLGISSMAMLIQSRRLQSYVSRTGFTGNGTLI